MRYRYPPGEANPSTKLTWEKVREMRARHARGDIAKALAIDYGVSVQAVYDILNGKFWKERAANLPPGKK